MSRKSAYFKEIERLLGIGYEPKHIMEMTGISKTTVYRIVDKLRKEARYDFKELMEKDYLYKYQLTLGNLSKTIQECNEEITFMKNKYKDLEIMVIKQLESTPNNKATAQSMLLSNLTTIQSNRSNELHKLISQRDRATDLKSKIYNQGPVVNAIDEWVTKNSPSMGELPRLKELDIINEDVIKVSDTSEPSEPINNEDDLRVLEEMKEDE